MKNKQLISVIVITYNSEKYVVETLESVKQQDYDMIELIISDDCSTDSTVEVCREWLARNKKRFIDTRIVEADKNAGIAPNCNRGIRESKGNWIKIIAGDDVLSPTILSEYISYCVENPDAKFLHSDFTKYKDSFTEENKLEEKRDFLKDLINQPYITAQEQNLILLRICPVKALTVMVAKEVFEQVGYFDERYPMWEDVPMWIRITAAGFKLHPVNIIGGKYRIHSSSVQRIHRNKIFSHVVIQRSKACLENYISKYPWPERVLKYILCNLILSVERRGMNVRNLFIILLHKSIFLPLLKTEHYFKNKYR